MNDLFWTDQRVRKALGIPSARKRARGRGYRGVSTDTRSIGEGDLFVALTGESFDGHDFLAKAAEGGATGAVVSRVPEDPVAGLALYEVDDTLVALGVLAAHRRDALDARVIGIAGSNGKTTTKELIRIVLETRFRTHATTENLNNRIGVPLTLLAAPDDAEVIVVEMGTNRPGEIATLTGIVRPDIAVITSIGEEHLELLGDLEGVLEEEASILEGLPEEGLAFVAAEPAAVPRRAREIAGRNRVRAVGTGESAEIRPDRGTRGIRVLADGSTIWRWRGIEARLPIPGHFNVRNALIALGIGLELGVPAQHAVRAIASVRLPGLRGEWYQYGELRVLADCYNANPPSVAAAVELLGALPTAGRRVAVLGSMRELGESSEQLHERSANSFVKMLGDRLDLIVGTGEFVGAFDRHREKHGEHLVLVEDPLEAYERARPLLQETDTILLKASRGDQLERWLPLLERDFGKASG